MLVLKANEVTLSYQSPLARVVLVEKKSKPPDNYFIFYDSWDPEKLPPLNIKHTTRTKMISIFPGLYTSKKAEKFSKTAERLNVLIEYGWYGAPLGWYLIH